MASGDSLELSPALVQRLVHRLFAAEDRAAASACLACYGASPSDAEPLRVQVAILKLSEGELKKLEHYLARAQQDYRDVLAWAEYPEQLEQPTWRMPADDVRRITKADSAQYLAWLEKHGRP